MEDPELRPARITYQDLSYNKQKTDKIPAQSLNTHTLSPGMFGFWGFQLCHVHNGRQTRLHETLVGKWALLQQWVPCPWATSQFICEYNSWEGQEMQRVEWTNWRTPKYLSHFNLSHDYEIWQVPYDKVWTKSPMSKTTNTFLGLG